MWTPYLRGERVPFHDTTLRAGLHGLDITHDAAAIERAAYEASGFVVRHMLDRASITARASWPAGGGTQVMPWMQAMADASGLPVDAVAVPEGSALGAAYLARWRRASRQSSTARSGGRASGRRVEPDPRWADAADRALRRGSSPSALTADLSRLRPQPCVGPAASMSMARRHSAMLWAGGDAVSPKEHDEGDDPAPTDDWNFPFEAELHAFAPGLHEAQNAWLSQIDSLRAPDRKTHELIRMVCTVILRNPPGVQRHAMLAAEVGATWDEIAGSIVLTEPAFGLLRVVEALPWARRGWERGQATVGDDGDDDRRRRPERRARALPRPSSRASAFVRVASAVDSSVRRAAAPPPNSARCTMVVRVSRADASTGSPANCRR